MDKRELAELVRRSIAPGEALEDFRWMVDALIDMERGIRFVRGRTARHALVRGNVDVASRLWFLCLLVKPKPPEYLAAMHQFRLALAGISQDERRREVFRASVRDRLLTASPDQGDIAPKPSLYFDITRAMEKADELGLAFDRPRDWY